jgi:hypothetical protein
MIPKTDHVVALVVLVALVYRSRMGDVTPMDDERRVRFHLGRAEDALDAATSAMLRIRELGEWREEYEQDIGILRDKLAILRTLMNGR